uniref:Protein EARLY FLOWERING 3 n=2 Tax=Anthurium amnicola TaxID=1678845 RepID=A0A1D1XJB3_9ARAE
MKGGRDDDKVMGPLFPRLHVNDADKGGPRAPPRNKMALYELFSIPSQRFNSDAASDLPLPPHQANGIVPSACSIQGCGHERNVSSPFCAPPRVPVHAAEKVHTCSMEGRNQNATRTGLETKPLKHGSLRVATTAGNVQMAVECSSFHPNDLSSGKDSFGKKNGDEDDFRVPTCVQRGFALHSDKGLHSLDTERATHFYLNSLQKNDATAFNSQSQVQSSHRNPSKQHIGDCLAMQQYECSSGEGQMKEILILHKSMEHSLPHPAIGEKADSTSNACKQSSNQEHPTCNLNDVFRSRRGSESIYQESNGSFGEAVCLNDVEVMEKQVISNGRSESCSKTPLNDSPGEPSMAEHCNAAGKKRPEVVGDFERTGSSEDADKIGQSGDAKKSGTPEDADKNDDVSETSMVDSLPGLDISPDDVVSLIGPKHFWKARRSIVNQQRVFAVQVFELHRLIKVQKLISESPNQLLGDASYLYSSPKASAKYLPASFLVKHQVQLVKQKCESHKVNNSEYTTDNTASADFLRPHLQIAKQSDGSHEVNCNNECPTENMAGVISLPREHGEGPISQIPRHGVPSFPVTSDNKSFHPPGNQWLIPVMSPSEGLIYKPYSGPCPPTAAFMAPVYSGFGPLSVSPVDLSNPAFGVPVSHQHQNTGAPLGVPAVAPSYFPAPYGLPVVNPLTFSSPAEQTRLMAGLCPNGQLDQHSKSSCNMSSTKSGTFSEHVRKVQKLENNDLQGGQKVQMSEDDDLQGSTASCPGDKAHGGRDPLPLFSVAAAVERSEHPPHAHNKDQLTRVIKVVPHNPRSATESAARIFRSIQKERQQVHSSV